MSQISRDNHFVPQAYLRSWSEDDQIHTFRTLVSHENVPDWALRSIKGVGYHRDLYTVAFETGDSDDFETWIATEFEEPASQVIARLDSGATPSADEFQVLARFFAAQDVRTPSMYMESTARWKQELPELIEDVLGAAVEELASEGAPPKPSKTSVPKEFQAAVNVNIEADAQHEDLAWIGASVTAGRSLWVASMRQLLAGSALQHLLGHSWTIAEPADGTEWFTSDHPALKLRYMSSTDYDFGGGWGAPGVDLILPLTPQYLLMTTVGKPREPRMKLSADHTLGVQQFLAERAHRSIFARRRMRRVKWWRKRVVDEATFKAEHAAWEEWDQAQREAEVSDVVPDPDDSI